MAGGQQVLGLSEMASVGTVGSLLTAARLPTGKSRLTGWLQGSEIESGSTGSTGINSELGWCHFRHILLTKTKK